MGLLSTQPDVSDSISRHFDATLENDPIADLESSLKPNEEPTSSTTTIGEGVPAAVVATSSSTPKRNINAIKAKLVALRDTKH